jgi:formylglycine-generating enzyme required for sulfatase activity
MVRPQKSIALLFMIVMGVLPHAEMHPARAGDHPDREFRECSVCPAMVAIPAGSFVMGSPAGEPGRFDAEGPQRRVTVSAFALGKYNVTVAEFLLFLEDTDYQPIPCQPLIGLSWKTARRGLAYSPGGTDPPLWPASCLNWNDAEAYVSWLNSKVHSLPSASGHQTGPYRLPSEAEWEYAARAGTHTRYYWGDDAANGDANCDGCGGEGTREQTAPVGTLKPNAFGLHDMVGNVWEWVEDPWHETYVGAPTDASVWLQDSDPNFRMIRGGSWRNESERVRSASRVRRHRLVEFDTLGFRVARTLQP